MILSSLPLVYHPRCDKSYYNRTKQGVYSCIRPGEQYKVGIAIVTAANKSSAVLHCVSSEIRGDCTKLTKAGQLAILPDYGVSSATAILLRQNKNMGAVTVFKCPEEDTVR